MTTQDPMLLCQVRSRLCALPLQSVLETMRPLPVDPVRGMPTFVLGAALIRGAPTPVVDPGVLLGCDELAAPTRFLLLRAGRHRVAFAVEGVLGVRMLAQALLAELPPLLRDAGAELVSTLTALDSELLVVLRTSCFLPQEIWRAVDEGAA